MRHSFTLLFMLACTCGINAQTEKFTDYQEDDKFLVGNNMSPNGKYIVGGDLTSVKYGPEYISGMASYVWNTETGTQEWKTEADIDNLANTGYFTDINDQGTVVGYFKDENYKITYTDLGVTATLPVDVAAVWENGALTSLGLGEDLDISECKFYSDGTKAVAISNDGNTIAGNYFKNKRPLPCVWKRNQDGGWDYQALELPQEEGMEILEAQVYDISADGNIIVGQIQTAGPYTYPVVWQDGKPGCIFPAVEDSLFLKQNVNNYAASVSQNGKYIGIVFNGKVFAMFDMEQGRYTKPEQHEVNRITALAVSDNGNAVYAGDCGSLLGGNVYSHASWYSHEFNRVTDFSYFMKIYAPTVEPPYSFETENKPRNIPAAISADGTKVMGYHHIIGPVLPTAISATTWLLETRGGNISIPAIPQDLKAQLKGMKKVELTWPRTESEDFTLVSYNIYQNGALLGNLPAEQGQESFSYTVEGAETGYPQYAISAVYSYAEDDTIESPKSDFAVTAVPENFDMPIFEDFETGTKEAGFWQEQSQPGTDKLLVGWGIMKYMGLEGYAVAAYLMDNKPYNTILMSRPMDATTAEGNIQLSFASRYFIYEGSSDDRTKDSLSIEVSKDWGDTWTEVKSWSIAELSADIYNFNTIDLTELVKGGIFNIRFRAHGQGLVQTRLFIDNISVSTESEQAPEGLMACDLEDGTRYLTWKNAQGAYELNYTGNPYLNAYGRTIGNEGKEIIAANLYDGERLKLYEGKYLTAVTTMLNWYDTEAVSPEGLIDVTLMVWEDDQLVREQIVEAPFFNNFFTTALEEPLQIQAGKTLKVGIKIANYDAAEMPLLYVNSMDYITGKSDLFSEDGGKTWSTILEAFEGSENPDDGLCAWRISANITDEPEYTATDYDTSILAYEVYRNGETANDRMIYLFQGRYEEQEPLAEARYEVRAIYKDGRISPLSEPLDYKASVTDTDAEQGGLLAYPTPATDILYIAGGCSRAELYGIDGRLVMTTGGVQQMNVSSLPEGVYVLKAERDGRQMMQKVVVSR